MDRQSEKIIVIGGSAGSFRLVSDILNSLPADFPSTLIICLHRLRSARNGFLEALSIKTEFEVQEPFDKEQIRPSVAYLAPANYHLLATYGRRFSLSVDDPCNHSRPSIDMTMQTIAWIYRKEVTGILLSGANMDGAKGLKRIKEKGGYTITQDPGTAEIKTMPQAAINLFTPDLITGKQGIIDYILGLKS